VHVAKELEKNTFVLIGFVLEEKINMVSTLAGSDMTFVKKPS